MVICPLLFMSNSTITFLLKSELLSAFAMVRQSMVLGREAFDSVVVFELELLELEKCSHLFLFSGFNSALISGFTSGVSKLFSLKLQ